MRYVVFYIHLSFLCFFPPPFYLTFLPSSFALLFRRHDLSFLCHHFSFFYSPPFVPSLCLPLHRRCNVQDYIWHKGARCESVVTEFQVMCLAVGASALVVLLLFMIIVCFAKKLHVLKTENKKLRKRR